MKQSMIAQRFQTPEENLLMDIATIAKKTPNLIDLSIGDPDLITDQSIIAAAFTDVKNGHTKYTASDGSSDFIQAVVDFYQNHYGLTFANDQVRASVGALHGMYLALCAILDPGDEVIIHEPYFSPYKQQVEMAGGSPVFIPTFEKDGFQIAIDVLKAAITDKTKAIIINSPNNPTGAVFSPTTFKAIAEVAEENDLLILSDEVYEAFCFMEEFVPMATFAPERTITFSSFSKAFAMTGWRIGFIFAPVALTAQIIKVHQYLVTAASTISQKAAVRALVEGINDAAVMKAEYRQRRDFLYEKMTALGFEIAKPSGAFYLFAKIPTGYEQDSMAFCVDLAEKNQLAIIPGIAFGPEAEGYVRLSYAASQENLQEAMKRLSNYMKKQPNQ